MFLEEKLTRDSDPGPPVKIFERCCYMMVAFTALVADALAFEAEPPAAPPKYFSGGK